MPHDFFTLMIVLAIIINHKIMSKYVSIEKTKRKRRKFRVDVEQSWDE